MELSPWSCYSLRGLKSVSMCQANNCHYIIVYDLLDHFEPIVQDSKVIIMTDEGKDTALNCWSMLTSVEQVECFHITNKYI